jgi:arylsulfatase A-like enzyme
VRKESGKQRTAGVIVTALAATLLLGGVAQGQSFPVVPGDPPPPPGENPRSPRPDIVVFVLDDIPPLDGRLWDKLPNIKRLFVEQGIEFTDAHGETPTCCPGRAGFLTGLHTHHHGAFKTDGSLFQPEMTIATQLRTSGYHTIQVGKYLNLFERVFPKLPPGWSDFHGFGGAYYDYRLWSNGRPREFGHSRRDYSTDVISRISVAALGRVPKNKNLFAWLTPFSMHKPWTVAPRHRGSKRCNGLKAWKPRGYMEKNVRDKPAYIQERQRKSRAGYGLKRICRGLLSVDQTVGDVVRKLKRLGRLDNTMLILTSDNGMPFGSQRILHDKKVPYATQIPLFVRWPRVLGTKPRQVDERVMNIDLAPTLCDIAKCTLGPYPTGQSRPDGLSFVKLLTGERTRLGRPATLASYQEEGHRVPTYWSARTTGSSPLARQRCKARRKGGCRWLFTIYQTGERELYDISNGPCYAWKKKQDGDPCMLKNLAGKKRYAQIQRAMANQLDRLR